MTAGQRPRRGSKRKGVTVQAARRLALELPAAVEGPCYGTPGYRVKGKLFARLREDGATVVVGVDRDTREGLMKANPAAFFVTDHYRNFDWMLVRLAAVTLDELSDMLRLAWSRKAPKRLIAAAK
ncbi:MAG TPA: MmcQ/YjbR family DNA-binding protein [Thermoanaerobaculia bacterium]|nr:MmcQ/YjbR family DNA-binding protein [Thermoanaerobaculia bacterium]